jgi:hypothetical protein
MTRALSPTGISLVVTPCGGESHTHEAASPYGGCLLQGELGGLDNARVDTSAETTVRRDDDEHLLVGASLALDLVLLEERCECETRSSSHSRHTICGLAVGATLLEHLVSASKLGCGHL